MLPQIENLTVGIFRQKTPFSPIYEGRYCFLVGFDHDRLVARQRNITATPD